ncbi:hypothetical protein DYB30_004000, partial [Aphanomyces astaci]
STVKTDKVVARNVQQDFTPSPSDATSSKGVDVPPTSPSKKRLFRLEMERVLHNLGPGFTTDAPLLHRAPEWQALVNFVDTCITTGQRKSMFVSGAPGSGKSALMKVMEQHVATAWTACKTSLQVINLNAMSLGDASSVYKAIAAQVTNKECSTAEQATEALSLAFKSTHTTTFLILDEIDVLLKGKGERDLYQLFEWAHHPFSSVIFVGIANSIDLTERCLPLLKSNDCKPVSVVFAPYSYDAICDILKQRVVVGSLTPKPVVDVMAMSYLARKIASTSGDIRTCLSICKASLLAHQANDCQIPVTLQDMLQVMKTNMNAPTPSHWQSLPRMTQLVLFAALQIKADRPGVYNTSAAYDKYCELVRRTMNLSQLLSVGEFNQKLDTLAADGLVEFKKDKTTFKLFGSPERAEKFFASDSSLEVEGWSKTKYSHGQLYLAPDADLMNFKMTVNVFERKRPALVLALELTNPPNTPNEVAIWDIVSAFLISAKCVSRIMLSAQATWYCSPRVENLAHLVPNVTMFETQRGATLKYLCGIFPESIALKSSFAQDRHAASSPQAAMPAVLPSPVGINDANTPSTCTLDSNNASLSPKEIPMEAIWRVLETWQWTRQETSARTWSYMHPTLTSPIHTDVGLRRYLGTSGLMRDVAAAAVASNSPIDRARTITRPPRPAMPMTAKTKKKKTQPRPKLVLGEIEDGLHQLGWKSFEGSLGTVYCKPHVVVFAGGRLKVASCSGVHGVDFFIGSTSLVEYVRGTPALEASVRHILASDTVVEAESVPTAAPQPPSSSRTPPLPATAALCPAPTLRSHGHKTSSSKAQFAAVFQELTKLGWTRRPSTLGYSYCKPPTDDLNEPTEFFSSADVEAYVRASGEWDRIEQLVQRKRSQRHRVVDDDSCDDVWAQLKAKGWTRKRLADGEVEFHAPLDGQHATSAEPVVMPGRKRRRRQRPADHNDDNMGDETKARMAGESDELAPQTTVASTLEGDEHRVELSTLVHEDRSSEPAQVEMIVLPEPSNNERTRALDALSPRYRLKSLVGRDVHWQAAMAFVARSFAVGCGSVCVSGPRGTGKSALVALLEEQVAAECAGRGRQLRPRHVDMSASVPRTSSLFVELANEMTNVQYASDADAMSALEETCRDPSWLTYEHDSPPHEVASIACAPYSKDALRWILNQRLPDNSVVDDAAIEFVAQQVAEISGDAQVTLDICVLAILLMQRRQDHVPVTVEVMATATSACLTHYRDQLMSALPPTTQMVLYVLMSTIDKTGLVGSLQRAYTVQCGRSAPLSRVDWGAHVQMLYGNGVVDIDNDMYTVRVTLENIVDPET